MTHEIKKDNIFNFLKAESIIEEIIDNKIEVYETDKGAKLKRVILTSLNKNSRYWTVDMEANSFQVQGKKVEKVILEQIKDGVLNIILVELKSGNVSNQTKILEKFKNSLSWVYLLLNLVHKEQTIKVFGILVSQDKSCKWEKRDKLNLFSSTSISYIKRSFYTDKDELTIDIENLILEKVKLLKH